MRFFIATILSLAALFVSIQAVPVGSPTDLDLSARDAPTLVARQASSASAQPSASSSGSSEAEAVRRRQADAFVTEEKC